MTDSQSYPVTESAHYLSAIRKRLEQLYEEHPNAPALREHLSDEVDWIDAELERLNNLEPVAWRWRPRGGECWIYNPEAQWLAGHRHEIEAEPLYGAPQPLGAAQGPIDLATVEACAKIAENNGWEATAAQIRALAIPSTLRQCPICARRVASPCETLAIATSCPLSSTTRGPAA